jgi:hypothetical protein
MREPWIVVCYNLGEDPFAVIQITNPSALKHIQELVLVPRSSVTRWAPCRMRERTDGLIRP